MRILVFTHNSWDDTNALGNTLSNFFCGDEWKNDEFYNIYMRNTMPNNKVCKNYYRMTIKEIIKKYFAKEKIGKKFTYDFKKDNKNESSTNKDQKLIDTVHKYSLSFVYPIMDYVYRRKRWLNENFKNYVNESNPDIFFSFVTGVSMLKPVIKYVKENTKAKIVLFIADDVYGSYDTKSRLQRNKLKKEFKEIVDMADHVYGASNELCTAYKKIFNKDMEPLYKGCSFIYQPKKKTNEIIKFVYAGNLFYGRVDILSKVAKAIDNSNKTSDKKAILKIYTGATITDDIKDKLNIKDSSIIVGKRPYDEIKKIENEADYVIHVESFEQANIDYVKYSFSTKIIDCLQSGSCLVGIGPKEIASMKYIEGINGAHVINKVQDIDEEIKKLIANQKNSVSDANKIREFAIKTHEIQGNHERMRSNFIRMIDKVGD